jgi:spermidine synthase
MSSPDDITSREAVAGARVARDEAPGSRRIVTGVALLLFVVSGASGLVYEVAWTRGLLLLLGSTAVAAAIVLSAFLGGLGLGARLGGRLADRVRRPLVLYGVLEVAAALWAVLVPVLLGLLDGPYEAMGRSASAGARFALRVAVTAVVVVPGAMLVGATFPAVLRALARPGRSVGPLASVLYGLNTLGAVVGSLWAGFFGIFSLGVTGAARLAAVVAAVAGVAAVALGARREVAPSPVAEAAPVPVRRGALVAAAVSGFVALGLEAAGVRILVFFVEGFTASFAAMLAVFLLGLAVGSLALGPLLSRIARPGVACGACLLAAGAAVLALAAAVPEGESFVRSIREWAYRGVASEADILAAHRWTALLGSALLFFAPALFLGATFPLAVRWARGEGAGTPARDDLGGVSGRVYLWNGVGSVLGPLAVLALARVGGAGDAPGGPLLAWSVLGLLGALAGGAILLASLRSPRAWILGAAVGGVAAGFAVPWVLTSATPRALVAASHVLRGGGRDGGERTLAVVGDDVSVRADDTTTASVVETATGERVLYTDDFAAAATGTHYPYMRLLGHLPALAAARTENALVIAFGTGTTAAAVAQHSGVQRLEIAETSRAVLSLADRFTSVNRGVLSDPRVLVRVEDGRNLLRLHAPDLDLITLEPLLPFTPAALPFYTRDFYRLAKERLRDGGVLCQWVPVHAMPLDLYASLLATFFREFPDGSLWFVEQSTILLGRKGTTAPDAATIQARAAEIQRPLRVAGYSTPEALAGAWVASGKRVLRSLEVDPTGPLSARPVTDDDPFPEAHPTPRGPVVTPYLHQTLSWLAKLVSLEDDPSAVPETRLAPLERMPPLHLAAGKGLEGRAAEAAAELALATGRGDPDRTAFALREYERATALYGEALQEVGTGDRGLQRRTYKTRRVLAMLLARLRLAHADAADARGDRAEAAAAREEALAMARTAYQDVPDGGDPTGTRRPAAAALQGEVLAILGRCVEAEDLLTAARVRWDKDRELADVLAAVVARKRGKPSSLLAHNDAARRLASAPPCREEPLVAVRRPLETFRYALVAGNASAMRLAAERVIASVRAGSVRASDAAAAVRETGETGAPETTAEKAALLRALDPADPGLPSLLSSDDAATWRTALAAAARFGFGPLRLEDAMRTAFVASPDATRRLAFVSVALGDGGPFALSSLADLLVDADLAVRTAAWTQLVVVTPEALRTEIGYDPAAPDAVRAAARERLRTWALARPDPRAGTPPKDG